MSDDRLLVLSLDALDEFNIYQLGLDWIASQYEERGQIFGCATLPHTAVSNPCLFGGIENEENFWVEREDGLDGEDTGQYVDPSQYFDRDKGAPVEGARGFSREQDYGDETFIWDDLYDAGYDARAVQVPIVLPPYSFRATRELEDAWFPDKKERMATHVREKPTILREQFEDGADAVFSSIQMPDKYLHAIGEGKASEQWVLQEAPIFEQNVRELLEWADSEGIDWMIFGDHGSPHPGAMKKNGYILPRHRKESIIIGSEDLDNLPRYTDEMYPWIQEYYGVSEAETLHLEEETIEGDVESRLENLGYL